MEDYNTNTPTVARSVGRGAEGLGRGWKRGGRGRGGNGVGREWKRGKPAAFRV